MTANLKNLLVVLAFALVIFRLAKPMAMHFTDAADFARRRNVWLILTVVGFVSPSFWLYVGIAIPTVIWARRKDSNPIALYLLLLQVIPSVLIAIPTIGISELFDLDNYRLLSFCILIPVALRLRRAEQRTPNGRLQGMDYYLLAFGALQVIFYVQADNPGHVVLPDSPTNVLRRALLFLVDAYALYYAVSRGLPSRRHILDAMAAFCLGCAIMAGVAIFESARHWLLYTNIPMRWVGHGGFYYERGGVVRAQASAGHALSLGCLLAVAFGFWLCLQAYLPAKRTRLLVTAFLWLGLIAAYSRGPWAGAVVIYLAFMAIGPGAFGRIFKAGAVIAAVLGMVSLSPLGDRIFKVLPFAGGATNDVTLNYRQRLAARAWQLIAEHPFFGDQLAYLKMEDLRQGEGIIDLVNSYAQIALFYGFVGLFVFVGFILLGVLQAYRAVRQTLVSDPEYARIGRSLVACILGVLLMLLDSSFMLAYEKMFYVLAGLTASYVYVRPVLERSPVAQHAGTAIEAQARQR